MSLTVIEVRRRVATVVLRPIDGLSATLGRPAYEQFPVRPVRFRIAGEVTGGVVRPIARGLPKPVFNLSGDTVLRDLALPAGTYRIEVDRDPLAGGDTVYEGIDAVERDLVWDPAAPGGGLPPDFPNHISRLQVIRLYPSASYPFPTASTLVRGSLFWYDGTALQGAVVREPAALITRSVLGPLGDFVLVFRGNAANGAANLQLDLGAVSAGGRPDGAAYLSALPAVWATQWQRGTTRSVGQGGLAGMVRRGDGRPLPGATIRLAGRPGFVRTNSIGRWVYYFPPSTPAGAVNITVQHPDFASVILANVAFPATATAAAPTVIMP